jgi:hypothetical protein
VPAFLFVAFQGRLCSGLSANVIENFRISVLRRPLFQTNRLINFKYAESILDRAMEIPNAFRKLIGGHSHPHHWGYSRRSGNCQRR